MEIRRLRIFSSNLTPFRVGGQAVCECCLKPSLANRNGPAHKARRRVVGQLFATAALRRYSPQIMAMVSSLAEEIKAAETPIALAEQMRRFAFSVIATTVLVSMAVIATICSAILKSGPRLSSQCLWPSPVAHLRRL